MVLTRAGIRPAGTALSRHIAAIAGVAETTVRNALREARQLGLVTVEERRVTGFRNDTDVVRIVSAEWSAWLRLARGRGALNLEETRRPSPAKGRGRGAVCLVPGPRPSPVRSGRVSTCG